MNSDEFEELMYLYDECVNEDENKLTEDGKKLRKEIIAYVESLQKPRFIQI
jgi:hypothetical protein